MKTFRKTNISSKKWPKMTRRTSPWFAKNTRWIWKKKTTKQLNYPKYFISSLRKSSITVNLSLIQAKTIKFCLKWDNPFSINPLQTLNHITFDMTSFVKSSRLAKFYTWDSTIIFVLYPWTKLSLQIKTKNLRKVILMSSNWSSMNKALEQLQSAMR